MRTQGGRLHVLALPRRLSHREATEVCDRVQELPEVESALSAQWVWRDDATPNDVHFNLQWNLKDDLGAERARIRRSSTCDIALGRERGTDGHPVPRRCSWQLLQPGGGEQVPGGSGRRVCPYQIH